MDEITFKRNELLAQDLIKNLESRHFEAYYCANKEEALKKALEIINEGSSITWGGATSAAQIGLFDALKNGNYEVIDRNLAKTPEERSAMMAKAFSCDYFIMGANAIAEEGILVNIDGIGNRLAALCFGPKNVIVIAGLNKVAGNLKSAVDRAKRIASPINAARFELKTPCKQTGTCHLCKSEDCICNQILITRNSKPVGRIKVILVNEVLGF